MQLIQQHRIQHLILHGLDLPIRRMGDQVRVDLGVCQQPTLNTDDTGFRIHGVPAFVMAFDTPASTVYQIRLRHRNQEVRELIPADYGGVMGADRGKSYDAEQLLGWRNRSASPTSNAIWTKCWRTNVAPRRGSGAS